MSIFIAPKLKGRKRSKKASTQDRKKVYKQERKKERKKERKLVPWRQFFKRF